MCKTEYHARAARITIPMAAKVTFGARPGYDREMNTKSISFLRAMLFLATTGLAAFAEDTPKPVIVAPPQHILLSPESTPHALQLEGITLRQNGAALDATLPVISGTESLALEAFWRPTVEITSSIPIEVTFWDTACIISRRVEFRAGPRAGESPWQAGSVYTQTYDVNMGEVASQFAGNGSMIVAVRTQSSGNAPATPVLLTPISVSPVIKEQPLQREAVAKTYPGATRLLDYYIRMSKGGSARVDVPEAMRPNVRALAVVSSMAYRGMPQGEVVARIIVNQGEPTETTLNVLSGEATARCDIDVVSPASLDHKKATVFESRDSAILDYQGRPVQLHTGAPARARGQLSAPVRAPRTAARLLL